MNGSSAQIGSSAQSIMHYGFFSNKTETSIIEFWVQLPKIMLPYPDL